MKFSLLIFLLFLFTTISSGEKCKAPTCTPFVGSIQTANLRENLLSFQTIATENNGNRAVGTSGYNASVAYVVETLRKFADCEISLQPFTISNWVNNAPASFAELTPTPQVFTDFKILDYSGSGTVTGQVSLPSGNENGCSAGDWTNFTSGDIALVVRGDCSFGVKTQLAQTAGASAVLIFNSDNSGSFSGTLGASQQLIVFGISRQIADHLIADPTIVVQLIADTSVIQTPTVNVLCTSQQGDPSATIVIGSHLDSVPAGPGINDNGSGSSVNLQLAIQSYRNAITLNNRVIFAWWAAEEKGLLGSSYFVQQAKADGSLNNIALNLNYDMLGSPNGIRQVLNGAAAQDPAIRPASAVIQDIYEKFFNLNHYPYEMKQFNGRSDYGPFISNGVPAGGLATGAEVIKNATERTIFGGLCNAPFDPCYHQSCDTIENINWQLILQMGQASAYTLEILAGQTDLYTFLGGKPQTTSSRSVDTIFSDGIWPFYY